MNAKRPADHDSGNDDALVLTNTERWVLRELLSVTPDCADYFVHKCEKNSVPLADAKALADVFDIDVPEERWDRYSPAR